MDCSNNKWISNDETATFHVNRFTDWDGFIKDIEQNIKLHVPLKTTGQLDKEAQKLRCV